MNHGPILKQKTPLDQNALAKAKSSVQAIPNGYIKLTYPSKGKLAIPETLHFRDYSLADISKLTTNTNKPKTVVSILNDLVLEDIDCADMHPSELLFTRLMIIKGFYGKNLKNVAVYVDDKLKGDNLIADSNITDVTLSIDSIPCPGIPDEVTNRITLERDDVTYVFRFPKQKDILLVDEYIESKYAEQDAKFARFKMIATAHKGDPSKILKDVDPDDYLDYTEYIQEQEIDRLQLLRTCQLVKYNDLEFADDQIDEKASVYIPYSVWDDATQIVDNIEFGFKDTAKVSIYKDGKTKTVSRRFSFREHTLIPEKSHKRNSKDISFKFS